ncbi:MAG TPA: type II secretion system F family protein [Candidatus Chromulinivoraceae bacterium]|nr:type II secretion system F family protein [Candidatus Chromulinivoraceae bacterium]
MSKAPRSRKIQRFHIRSKDRESFTSNLALLLRAGVPIGEAFQSMREVSGSKPLNQALTQMQADVEEGMQLWKSLDRSGIVSGQTLALVQLGEQAGRLVDNLRVAAKQEEKQRVFKSKIRSALLYPTFVLSVTGLVGIGVSWFLLPRLAQTFSQLKLNLPLISQILIGFGTFLQNNGIWAVPGGLVIIILLCYLLFANPKTKGLGQRLMYRIPGVSKLLYEVEIARFGYLLGTLLSAGLSVTQALQLLYDASSSVRYRKFYLYLKGAFEDGYSFKESLMKYKEAKKLLPPAIQQMIIAGERSAALPETLTEIGNIYEERADVSTQSLEVVLEPILLVLVAGGVLMVAVAVILPIYSLVGGLGT